MAIGDLTPLQLTAGAGLLQNQGLSVNPEFTVKIQEYETIPFISNFLTTLSLSQTANLSSNTISQLQTLGNVVCPALADSIPNGFVGSTLPLSNSGFLSTVATIGNNYVTNVSRFAQAFASAEGYIGIVNPFITAACEANDYLGPTFSNLNDMISADLTKVTDQLQTFGQDIQQLGQLIDLANLPHLGEPAALLQQLVAQGKALLPCVNSALQAVGLSQRDITDLTTDNRQSLFNPSGLTENQFGKLQRQAYQGMSLVSGDCLSDVLEILEVSTPGIEDMTDLFDPVKIFPNSYPTLKFGDQLIYQTVNGQPTNSVNSSLAPVLNATTPSGCDELGKITSPNQAVANKALQFSLQQVSGIQNLTLPELAEILA
jgi:hypothetical protein